MAAPKAAEPKAADPKMTVMQTEYVCQNPHDTTSSTLADVNGETMTVSVNVYEVELVALDRSNGGIKLRFMGSDVDGAKTLFKNDVPITASFQPGPPLPPDYVTP